MIRTPRFRFVQAATLACGAVLGSVIPSLAQQGWTGSVTTISGIVPSIGDARLAVDATGGVTAVWVEEASTAIAFTVKASRMAAGGTWSAPVALSPPLPGADATVAAGAADGALAVWTSDGGVYVARYSAGAWGAAATIAARSNAHGPDVALDSAGNATVVWYLDGTNRVEAVRYAAATSAWGTVVDLGAGRDPQIAVDLAGNAVAIWGSGTTPAPVQTARYTAATDSWGAPITLATGETLATDPDVAMTGTGTAFAVWTVWNNATIVLQTATYNSYTGAWSGAATLQTTTLPVVPAATVVMARDAPVIGWTMSGQSPMFSRLDTLTTSGWSPPAPIAQVGPATSVDLAVDGLDGVVAVWQLADGRVQASRCFETTGMQWTPPVQLAAAGRLPRVAVAQTGASTVIWTASAAGVAAVQGTQWVATLGAPRITGATASAGTLTLEFAGPGGPTWPEYGERTYEYSVDDGVTWAARVPASTNSPIVIGGLTDFTPYRLRLRVVNIAGPGSPSPAITASAGPGTDAPSGLTATDVDGSIVTLTWAPPRIGAAPTGYVLEGGVAPGQILASLDTGSAAPTITLDAPAGVFYLRVRAVTFNYLPPRLSAPSNETRVAVNVPELPSAPAHLLGLVDGSTLTLSWTNTFAGGAPTGMQVLVSGTLSGSAPIPMGDTFVVPNVPPGTYTLQVVAVNASGASAPSNPVTLTFPAQCTGAPGPPTLFVAEQFEGIVSVAWSPPTSGAAVTSYTLSVTGSFTGALATTLRTLWGTLPPGTYTFRVVATNPCGESAPAAPQTVVVP